MKIIELKKEKMEQNIKKLYEAMKFGRRYRPYNFKSLNVAESTIWRYLNRLCDDNLVDRRIDNGKISFYKLKDKSGD